MCNAYVVPKQWKALPVICTVNFISSEAVPSVPAVNGLSVLITLLFSVGMVVGHIMDRKLWSIMCSPIDCRLYELSLI